MATSSQVPYHALLVLSLSVTSDDPAVDPSKAKVTKENAEIIDIAWSVLNTATFSVTPVKHVSIKPASTPITKYCTTQTGLTEADLVEAGNFASAVDALDIFIEESLVDQQISFCLCAQGAWNLSAQLKNEAARKEVMLPGHLYNPTVFDLKQELSKWSSSHGDARLDIVNLDDLTAVAKSLGLQTPDTISSALEHCAVMAAVVRHLITHDQGAAFTQPIDTGADLDQFRMEKSRVVHLCGLPDNCTQPELHEGRASGSGFAIARTHEEALQMITLNGRQLRNRVVDVSPSNENVLEAASGITGPFPENNDESPDASNGDNNTAHATTGDDNTNTGYSTGHIPVHSRPGDWACPNCQFHNFATRQYCLKCQTSAPMGTGTPGGRHPGDWTCPNGRCGFLNYASRSQCLRCSTFKPDTSGMAGGYNMSAGNYGASNTGGGGGGASNPHGFRPGDWICPNPNCYFQNFASRTACYRCHTPNPNSMYDMSMYADPNMNSGYAAYNPVSAASTAAYGAPPPPPPPVHGMDAYGGAATASYANYPSYPSYGGSGGGGATFRPGDWYCPNCSSHNFASRLQCMRCHIPRPGGSQAAVAAMLKPGDWLCSCGYHNFAKRPQCGKCGRAPDPQQAAQQQEYLQQSSQPPPSGSANDYNPSGY
ncbi:hypothetical protein BDF19DRAFT_446993 [Syncephalis fuscata]|nr:hypothetical protein BDF19DRAFT_446993 [Syncephalis fuscata]